MAKVQMKQNLQPRSGFSYTAPEQKQVGVQKDSPTVLSGHNKAQAAPKQMKAADPNGIDVRARYNTLQEKAAEVAYLSKRTKVKFNSLGQTKRIGGVKQGEGSIGRLGPQAKSNRASLAKVKAMSVEEYSAYSAQAKAQSQRAEQESAGASNSVPSKIQLHNKEYGDG